MTQKLHLSPGDRIIVPKSQWRWIQHHAIYSGDGYFYENKFGEGVICTPADEFFKGVFEITAIQRFTGNAWQLRAAMTRAENSLGKPYHAVRFNCEHFADFVQFGNARSHQIENAMLGGAGLLLLLSLVAGSSRNI